MKLALTSLIAFTLSTAAAAAPPYCGPTYCPPVVKPVYHAPPAPVVKVYPPPAVVKVVHPPEPNVTVINNLIGVPVPIAYDRPLALQGATYYGYTKVSDVFAPFDAALYLDKAERLTTQALTLSQNARDSFDSGAQTAIQAQRDVALSLSVGQVAREIVAATADAQAKLQAASALRPGVLAVREAPQTASGVLQSRCVACHATYNDWSALDADTQARILDRVTSADSAKRMPRGADKASPGDPLPVEELKLLFLGK